MSDGLGDGLRASPCPSIVTLLTDFGWGGGYVAACEAVIISVAPQARILHISHDISVGDVRYGGLVLSRVAPLYPIAVHLAVVDPGVGTDRRPLALLTERGDVLVGPDNGLLLPAAQALGGATEAWSLDSDMLREQAGLAAALSSSTFHGRDVFAPAAALLSNGILPSAFGTPLDSSSLSVPEWPVWRTIDGGILAEVVEVDRFGNVELAAPFEELATPGLSLTAEVEGEGLPAWNARMVQTFGHLNPGELGVFRDSWGYLALALNGASAAELLSVERGMSVRLVGDRQGREEGPSR